MSGAMAGAMNGLTRACILQHFAKVRDVPVTHLELDSWIDSIGNPSLKSDLVHRSDKSDLDHGNF